MLQHEILVCKFATINGLPASAVAPVESPEDKPLTCRSAAEARQRRMMCSVGMLSWQALSLREIAALTHKPRNHAVKTRALEVQRLPGLTHALLTGAQGTEVLNRQSKRKSGGESGTTNSHDVRMSPRPSSELRRFSRSSRSYPHFSLQSAYQRIQLDSSPSSTELARFSKAVLDVVGER